MALPVFDNYMSQDASRLVDKVYSVSRAQGRVSALIGKGEIPEGAGYNYSTVIAQRSSISGGSGWTNVSLENGSGNNCVQNPATINPATNEVSWTVQAQQIRSNPICFEDLKRAYSAREQLDLQHDNFARKITDIWEDSDNLAFFTYAGTKIIANSSLTSGSTMPLSAPSTRGIQGILDILYEQLSVDGACEESYATANGQPLIPAIMSQQQHRNIIKEDASVRQDFNYADMGQDMGATMMKGWGSDMKAYGGFQHIVNIRQPRYDWISGAWVQRSYYTTEAATIGTAEVVNSQYTNAAYEDIYLWHKQVVKRNMPNPGSSFGAGTSFDPVKWTGAVVWVNIKNGDESSSAYNPFGNWGRYYAALQRGYQPIKPQYGKVIRVQRCAKFTSSACY